MSTTEFMDGRLRVLWLTPVQFPAATGADSMRGGGWMEGWRWSLEVYHPEVSLIVLSQGDVVHEPLEVGKTTYHSLPRVSRGKYGALWQRWRHHEPSRNTDLLRSAFQALVSSERPDLVHVHGSESGLARIPIDCNAPVLVSLQGIAAVWERFMFAGTGWLEIARDVARPEFLKGYGITHAYLGMRKRASLERETMRRCRYVLGNTDWDKAAAAALFPSAAYYRSDRAVRPEFYDASWSPHDATTPIIYSTGSAAPYKGIETLLEAASLLRRGGIESFEIRIGGPVERSYRWSTLQGMVEKFGLQGRVEWLGSVNASQIVSELERASVFVQPSHIENESNVLIEALLVGTPCIAAGVGGIPSVMTDGVDGLLYHDRDPYALAGCLRLLLSDSARARTLAAQGRETAHRRHDPERVADQLLKVYREVIRDHSSSM